MEHKRQIYGFLDVLGDFGGVKEILESLAAFLLGPIAAHAYLSKAISKLYLAKTSDESVFKEKHSEKAKSK